VRRVLPEGTANIGGPKRNDACRIVEVHHVRAVSVFFILFVVLSPASGHHSFDAEYNSNRPVTLTGRVVKLLWQNPHAFLYIDVVDAKTSRTTNWSIELGSISNLTRQGWTQDSLKPAQEIKVKGIHAFARDNKVLAREITLPNGERLAVGYSEPVPQ
jgi:hypothetical protein